MQEPSRHRVLVTGGAEFLGSHLCTRLIAEGHEVLCLDNFYTGNKDNVAGLLGHPRFEIIRHDISQPLWVEVDEIFNLACPASPIHYQTDPVQTTKTGVLGALHVLGLANRLGARVLQASTSEVYGDPKVHPQAESYWRHVNPIGIRACYDEGKRCAETLFFDYQRQLGVRIKVARIFNTYGRPCTRTTAASSRTSSCRRCADRRSRSTATARRRARSAATWTTSWMASAGS